MTDKKYYYYIISKLSNNQLSNLNTRFFLACNYNIQDCITAVVDYSTLATLRWSRKKQVEVCSDEQELFEAKLLCGGSNPKYY
jgi:hypothetical protein